jgi:hypothetical protein
MVLNESVLRSKKSKIARRPAVFLIFSHTLINIVSGWNPTDDAARVWKHAPAFVMSV